MLTRLDDGLIDHEKIERAGEQLGRYGYERALGAATWGIVYANRRLTDGHLLLRALEKYQITKATADALVAAGLWALAESGYQIHDFLDWNPSAAAVKAKQSKDRARKRSAFGFQTESARNPDGSQADITEESDRIPRAVVIQDRLGSTSEALRSSSPVLDRTGAAGALLAARFETFWAAYPNKKAKKDAEKAFHTLKPDPELQAGLLEAVERHKATRQWREGVYPHAATWLRGERWKDELLPERTDSGPFRGPIVPVKDNPKAADWVAAREEKMRRNDAERDALRQREPRAAVP